MSLSVVSVGLSPSLAFAQNYPLPGHASEPDVICTNCNMANGNPTFNSYGQDNTGLKTWPYDSPIKDHVGRLVDSTIVTDFQNGFRTARAKKLRVAAVQRGTAPPRVYVQIGSAVAAYNLSSFFATTLPAGTVPISAVAGSVFRGGYPYEQVAQWDAWVYPEKSGSGWTTPTADGQDRLNDFDFDDRGYLYIASGSVFGFGIVQDSGESGGQLLPLVHQVIAPAVTPDQSVVVKVGPKYFLAISGVDAREVYDVTTPSAPVSSGVRSGAQYAFTSWAKDDVRQMIAVLTREGRIEVSSNAAFASATSAVATFTPATGATFHDVTVDNAGNFWSLSSSGTAPQVQTSFVKIERTATGYVQVAHPIAGSFQPLAGPSERVINYGDERLAIVGKAVTNAKRTTDVRLFRIEGGAPVNVDLKGFFASYYHAASPIDFANPPFPSRMNITGGAYPVTWNGRDFLIYEIYGLGDAFELEPFDAGVGPTPDGGSADAGNEDGGSADAGGADGGTADGSDADGGPPDGGMVTPGGDAAQDGEPPGDGLVTAGCGCGSVPGALTGALTVAWAFARRRKSHD